MTILLLTLEVRDLNKPLTKSVQFRDRIMMIFLGTAQRKKGSHLYSAQLFSFVVLYKGLRSKTIYKELYICSLSSLVCL